MNASFLCDEAEHKPHNPFIVGCGRSGTTLLRAILMSSPVLAIPPEAPFVAKLLRTSADRWDDPQVRRECVSTLHDSASYGRWELPSTVTRAVMSAPSMSRALFGLYREYARLRGKPRWGDKTPGNVLHLQELSVAFDSAIFLHLIRDGRDVVASHLRLGWYSTVEEAAANWTERVRIGRTTGAHLGTRYFEVYYEDLVRRPLDTLRSICGLIGIVFHPTMLHDWSADADDLLRTIKFPESHMMLKEPITPSRIGAGVAELESSEIEAIEMIAGDTLQSCGYKLNSDPRSWTPGYKADAIALWQTNTDARKES